jgi:hypothetical protein
LMRKKMLSMLGGAVAIVHSHSNFEFQIEIIQICMKILNLNLAKEHGHWAGEH